MCFNLPEDEQQPVRKRWSQTRDGVYESPISIGGYRALIFVYQTEDVSGRVQFGAGISAPFSEREYLNVQYTPGKDGSPLLIDKDTGKVGILCAHRTSLESEELPLELRKGLRGLLDELERELARSVETIN